MTKCDVRFIEFVFRHLGATTNTSVLAVCKLNLKTLNELRLKQPLGEQRAIAHILGTLDDKIELNRQINQTLEEMARAIYKDWFVDFGPTLAKLEGSGTLPAIRTVGPVPRAPSGLGVRGNT